MKKRLLALLSAMCVAFCLAAPAFAVSAMYVPAYDETKDYGLVDSGVLDDGTEYWVINLTPEEVVQHAMSRSYDWSGSVTVPIANKDGTNGAKVGYDFNAYPDEYVVVEVGNLPSTMPSVNVSFYYTNKSAHDWVSSVGANAMVVFKLKYPNNTGYVNVSTYESKSVTTQFKLYTSDENPADGYTEV